MLEANKSYYNSLLWLCGLLFGVGHFFFLTSQSLTLLSTYTPYGASLVVLGCMLYKKARLERRGEKLYSYQRTREHIIADFAVATALVSTFSVLVYLIRDGNLRIVVKDEASRPQIVLFFNLISYLTGMFILSHKAEKERELDVKKDVEVVGGEI